MTSHQINIKVSSDDLKYIDAKAKRYGLSRSAMIKVFALNAEMKVIVSGELRQPRL
jgi:predicted DNA binding CopG/RHH family protein